jgi:hypothetical protein
MDPVSDAIDELAKALDAAGAVVVFDPRNYARVAKPWPDCLPPMFGRSAVAVERWGRTWQGQWIAQHPRNWPKPTVRAGEVWMQKSSSIRSWKEAANATGIHQSLVHVVVRVDGEQFLNDRGVHWPWVKIPGPDWRRLKHAQL